VDQFGVIDCPADLLDDANVPQIDVLGNIVGLCGRRNAEQTDHLITAREQQRELEIAKNIQLSLLPTHIPQVSGIQLGGICIPAKEVGGDYYDFLLHDDGRLDLVIADVSGHNVGAAVIMAETRTMIRSRRGQFNNPREILYELNQFFYDDLTRAELFVTLFYLQYQPDTRQITFASAGHSPSLLWQEKVQQCLRLDPEGLIIGVKKEFPYEQESLMLNDGDILLLYTDGVIEAENSQNELFGEDRLTKLLKENCHLPPQEMINHIIEQVRLFSGHHNFQDDVSLVVMQIKEQ
jgi:serine phosphatase RsbU (regulator of sigma subunit)